MISIVTPAYNEADNLPAMYERLAAALSPLGLEWEWLIIDDASGDSTFSVAARIAELHPGVQVKRFSRNFGSHVAVMCGLEFARGACVIVMASDLQDPPETIPSLVSEWRAGNHVVWAVRMRREGELRSTLAFAQLYYWIMRRFAGLTSMPAMGADFVLLDRRVVDALCHFRENNTSFFALVTWMGFRQGSIVYAKQARASGSSGWTLRKKIKLVLDLLTAFSYLPIRWMSYAGLIISALGLLYGAIVVANAIFGHPTEGWTSLMVAVLFLGGGQMFMLGVLGEYIWRGLDEARRRPRYLVEDTAGSLGATHRRLCGKRKDVLARNRWRASRIYFPGRGDPKWGKSLQDCEQS